MFRKALLLALFCLSTEVSGQRLAITYLDVGQGDAALIRSPSGRNVLVDAGPNPTQVADWLRRNGVDTVHLVVASHNHADHIGGMPRVLETVAVRNYMDNGMAATTKTYARIVTALEARGVSVLRAEPRRIDLGGGAFLRVLSGSPRPRSQNDASIGLELTYGRFRALFTGDAEPQQRRFWSRDSLSTVTVLKVSHHGSINGTDAAWLASLQPCVAIISVGARNSFGHPSPHVERMLDSAHVIAFRTDRAGQVSIEADSLGAFSVSAGKPEQTRHLSAACQPVR